MEASPLCVIYELLSELNTDIPVTQITIADHDCPPWGFPASGMPGWHSEIAAPDFRTGSKCEKLVVSTTSPAYPPKADMGADIDLRRCGPIVLQKSFEHLSAKH